MSGLLCLPAKRRVRGVNFLVARRQREKNGSSNLPENIGMLMIESERW